MYWPGIEVMTIHFLCIIGPFNCQHFQRPLPVSASVTPAHPEVGAPEGKLEIATICNGDPKQTFDFFAHCILPTIIDILELSFLVFFYTVKNVSFTLSTTWWLFPNPIWPLFLERGCREQLQNAHVRSCRRWFPTDKRSPVAVKV